ncbi:MAG: hypothetical protein P4L41_07835, partial [Flavipsychrobacter sp.]|nr:hypothetical protein [Flavipsychrobacter sp.]
YYKLISPPATFSLGRESLNVTPYLKIDRAQAKRQVGPGPATALGAGGLATIAGTLSAMQALTTDYITLSKVPYLIAIQPTVASENKPTNISDFFYALDDTASNILSIQWDNQPVCTSLSKYELYKMYRANGGQQPWIVWSGQISSNYAAGGGANAPNAINMRGGIILLKPGIDFPIGLGLSPNSPCDLKFQVTVNVRNQTMINGSTANASILNVWCLYTEYLVNDLVDAKTATVPNIITPSGILESDRMAPAVTENEVTDDAHMVGGSFMHRFKKKHRGMKHKNHHHAVTHNQHGGVMSAGVISAGSVAKKASHRAIM